MRYTRKPIIIEAFQAGTDDIPQWFMDRVDSGQIILTAEDGGWCTMMRWNSAEVIVKKGDYIANTEFPFVVYDEDHFKSIYLLGDLTSVYDMGFSLINILEEVDLNFNTREEVYNSLHEDLRDLRRLIQYYNGDDEAINEQLLQISATSLKARKDLYES